MPRLPYLEDHELTDEAREFIKIAETAGSPDPRVLRIITRSPAGRAWYRYWQALNNEGELEKSLKELCRVKIAFDHTCGYCSTVRNTAAKVEGLTEDKIQEVWDFENSTVLSEREKTALRFAHYIKWDIDKADSDEFYADLRKHFTESEIIELGLWCAENEGAGKFVRTLKIVTWDEACELNPQIGKNATKRTGKTAQAAE